MKQIMFILPLLFVIPVVIYVYMLIGRMMELIHMNREHAGIKVIIGIITAAILVLSILTGGMGLIVIFHIAAVALVVELINLIIHKRSRKKKKVWMTLYKTCLIPILITALFMGYGLYNMKDIYETDYTVYTDKKLRNEGYKVAMISDLHYGVSLSKKELQACCDEISEKNPDFVVLDGDIVDERTSKEEMKEAIKVLSSIKNQYGIYYVYGNHDKAAYSRKPAFTVKELEDEISENQIQVMKDSVKSINDDLEIIGRDDRGYAKGTTRKSDVDLKSMVSADKFLLVLDHQPCELKENDSLGFDLQLSGHTHNGQIFPVGIIGSVLHANEMTYGFKQMSHMQVIVSSGMAGWGFPIRTESHSEYVMLSIQKK